jgi:fructose-1,6-bisphosphatase/inositol monophosphatase family enzyme
LPDPLYLATAVEIVLRAGDLQLAGQQSGFRVDKKGSIDLVTEVDLACERMCRDTIAERFPGHDVLAEELGSAESGASPSRFRWGVRSARRHHQLRAWPADLLFVAGTRDDGRAEVAAIYDPTRRELFTASAAKARI